MKQFFHRASIYRKKMYLCSFLVFFALAAQAQKTITGKVVDAATNKPLAAISVSVKNGTAGTFTDDNGSFSLKIPADNLTIEIKGVGYQSLEIPAGGGSDLGTIRLTETISSLDQVVVVGYTSQKKKDLTGAVAVVNMDQALKQPASDPASMLQGQAPGVTVVGNGQPGQSPTVQIRGLNSFGNNGPLYIIDGVPTQDASTLNPFDIASMQILKDAGAASIYGSRASNGIIIVTTKRGSGKVKVSYDGYYGTQRPKGGNVWDLLNPTEEEQLMVLAQNTFNTLNPTQKQLNGNAIYGPLNSLQMPDYLVNGTVGGVTYTGGYMAGSPAVNPANYNADPTGANYYLIEKANQTGTDWYHAIFKPALIQQHNLAVSGGGDIGSYLFSLNYFDQQGTLINTYLKRFTLRSNSQFRIGNHVRVGENLAYSVEENPQANGGILTEGGAIGMSFRENTIIPVYDIMGNYGGSAPNGLNNGRNPVAIQANTVNDRYIADRLLGNVYGEADLIKDLTFRTVFGGEYHSGWDHTFATPDFYNAEPSTTTPTYSEQSYSGYNWTWTNTFNYHFAFGKNDFKVLAGMEAYYATNHNMGTTALQYFTNDPNFVNTSTALGTVTAYSNNNININYNPSSSGYLGPIGASESLESFFARVDYAFDDKYLVGATIRRDGSSKFINYRWGNFPAVSIGWRISKEDFMKNIKWINDLKIRGSYGIMGNQFNALSTNSYNLYVSNKTASFYNITGSNTSTTPGIYFAQIGNPDAKWERDANTNIGFDATILNSQIQITADWYNKKISGLLYQPTLLGTQGAATVPAYNVASMSNKGFDIAVNGQAKITRDLNFFGTLTFTTINNKITAVNTSGGADYFDADSRRFNGSYIVRNEVGHPVSAFYGYKVIGFWNSQDEINAADQLAQQLTGNASATYQQDEGVGRFKYAYTANAADIKGSNYLVSPDSRQFLGNPSPKFNYGFNFGFNYKKFDISMFLYGVYGNQIFNDVRWYTDFYASFPGAAASKTALYNSWTPTHQNAKAPIQDAGNGVNMSTNAVPNSYFVEPGSYLRAKNITLGYTFDQQGLGKAGIASLRAYIQATNVFTITKYSGIDPESVNGPGSASTTDFGIDVGPYAAPKQFLFGLQITFK